MALESIFHTFRTESFLRFHIDCVVFLATWLQGWQCWLDTLVQTEISQNGWTAMTFVQTVKVPRG